MKKRKFSTLIFFPLLFLFLLHFLLLSISSSSLVSLSKRRGRAKWSPLSFALSYRGYEWCGKRGGGVNKQVANLFSVREKSGGICSVPISLRKMNWGEGNTHDYSQSMELVMVTFFGFLFLLLPSPAFSRISVNQVGCLSRMPTWIPTSPTTICVAFDKEYLLMLYNNQCRA